MGKTPHDPCHNCQVAYSPAWRSAYEGGPRVYCNACAMRYRSTGSFEYRNKAGRKPSPKTSKRQRDDTNEAVYAPPTPQQAATPGARDRAALPEEYSSSAHPRSSPKTSSPSHRLVAKFSILQQLHDAPFNRNVRGHGHTDGFWSLATLGNIGSSTQATLHDHMLFVHSAEAAESSDESAPKLFVPPPPAPCRQESLTNSAASDTTQHSGKPSDPLALLTVALQQPLLPRGSAPLPLLSTPGTPGRKRKQPAPQAAPAL